MYFYPILRMRQLRGEWIKSIDLVHLELTSNTVCQLYFGQSINLMHRRAQDSPKQLWLSSFVLFTYIPQWGIRRAPDRRAWLAQ